MTEFCDGENPTYPIHRKLLPNDFVDRANEYVQNCVEEPSPPDAVGMKSAFALQLAGYMKI